MYKFHAISANIHRGIWLKSRSDVALGTMSGGKGAKSRELTGMNWRSIVSKSRVVEYLEGNHPDDRICQSALLYQIIPLKVKYQHFPSNTAVRQFRWPSIDDREQNSRRVVNYRVTYLSNCPKMFCSCVRSTKSKLVKSWRCQFISYRKVFNF